MTTFGTQNENFRPVTDVIPLVRRDFPLTDPTLADPRNPLSYLDGEWMTLDSTGKLVRSANIAAVGNSAGAILSWPVWAENGRTDIQAMADRKPPIIWLNQWECETLIYDASATIGSGLAITTRFQKVKVASIQTNGVYGPRVLSGLVGWGGASDTDQFVGYVTRLPAENSGWLRIKGGVFY